MSRYIVVGPERTWVDVVCDDGTGPSFPEHDVYLVDAPNRRVAKWAAFNHAKKRGDRWWRDLYDEHPLKGVTVEDVSDEDTPSTWQGFYINAEILAAVAGSSDREPDGV